MIYFSGLHSSDPRYVELPARGKGSSTPGGISRLTNEVGHSKWLCDICSIEGSSNRTQGMVKGMERSTFEEVRIMLSSDLSEGRFKQLGMANTGQSYLL